MKRLSTLFFLGLFSLLILPSCGDDEAALLSESGVPGENRNPSEVDTLRPVKGMCDLFSKEHNDHYQKFANAFPKEAQACVSGEVIDQKKKQAFMRTYAFASELLSTFDQDANRACLKVSQRSLKRFYQIEKRKLNPTNENREIQNLLAKSSLDNLLRRSMALGCIEIFETLTYLSEGSEETFTFESNFLQNSSFEYYREKGKRGFQSVENSWALVEGKFFPGWRVKSVHASDGDEAKKCDFIEVQGKSVSSGTPVGKHMIELNSHCLNSEGKQVKGKAQIEISQRLFVKRMGDYKFTFKAQKRDGVHGKLELAVFQRNREKAFQPYELTSEKQWQEGCLDVPIPEEGRAVKIHLRDGSEGEQNRGVLLDDLSFSEGSCD